MLYPLPPFSPLPPQEMVERRTTMLSLWSPGVFVRAMDVLRDRRKWVRCACYADLAPFYAGHLSTPLPQGQCNSSPLTPSHVPTRRVALQKLEDARLVQALERQGGALAPQQLHAVSHGSVHQQQQGPCGAKACCEGRH